MTTAKRERRPRPYIPIKVRLIVAVRQLHERGLGWENRSSKGEALRLALVSLGLKKPHLDHRPPLALRKFNKRAQRYTPDANDPRYLQWIEGATDHHELTHGRGGEKMRFGGDLREIRKQDRLEREPEKWRGLLKLKGRSRRSGVSSKRMRGKKKSSGFGLGTRPKRGGPKRKIRSRGFPKRPKASHR